MGEENPVGSRSAAVAPGGSERRRVRVDLHSFETPRRTDRGARVRAGPRWAAGHAPGAAVRSGAYGAALRVDRAGHRGTGALVLRGERCVHRSGRGEALV